MHEAQQPVPTGTVAEAGSTIIRETALGVVLIVVLVLFVWAVRALKAVQDARVEDKEKAADRIEKANEEYRKLYEEMTKALSSIVASQGEQSKALDRNTRALEDVRRTMDNVVREAFGVYRRPSTGTMAAVRESPRVEARAAPRTDPRQE